MHFSKDTIHSYYSLVRFHVEALVSMMAHAQWCCQFDFRDLGVCTNNHQMKATGAKFASQNKSSVCEWSNIYSGTFCPCDTDEISVHSRHGVKGKPNSLEWFLWLHYYFLLCGTLFCKLPFSKPDGIPPNVVIYCVYYITVLSVYYTTVNIIWYEYYIIVYIIFSTLTVLCSLE